MKQNEYIIVKVTPDSKAYTYWVVSDYREVRFAEGQPQEPQGAEANRTTSTSTLGTAIGTEMPGLT